MALAAQHGYVQQLAAELSGTGVYAGVLNIGVLIGNSVAEELIDNNPELVPEGLDIVRMSNNELGEHYWRMYVERDSASVDVGFPE